MTLGALVDAGVSFDDLVRGLKRLGLSGFRLRRRRVRRGAIHATKIDVQIAGSPQGPFSLKSIHSILSASRLPEQVKRRSRLVFDRLAEAEALAHRVDKSRVHFHEVSVLDSFVDVVGAMIACELLGVTRVTASAVNVGAGILRSAHGTLPAPGPAVAVLSKGIPIYSAGPSRELATPTGLAVLRTLASEFGPMPLMTPSAVGYGAGDADPEGWPNVLRLFVAHMPSPAGRGHDTVMQLETNLDDVNPQIYESLLERLFQAGALDVTLTPVIMKRGRPGITVTCLAPPAGHQALLDVLFRETTTLGVRVQEVARQVLPRRVSSVKIHGGTVRVKIGSTDGDTTKSLPEYLDCKKIADRTGRPVRAVLQEAAWAYAKSRSSRSDRS
jgi:hypothetical protein